VVCPFDRLRDRINGDWHNIINLSKRRKKPTDGGMLTNIRMWD
jgi:hypothetical protein